MGRLLFGHDDDLTYRSDAAELLEQLAHDTRPATVFLNDSGSNIGIPFGLVRHERNETIADNTNLGQDQLGLGLL